jgi:hypothetical protein
LTSRPTACNASLLIHRNRIKQPRAADRGEGGGDKQGQEDEREGLLSAPLMLEKQELKRELNYDEMKNAADGMGAGDEDLTGITREGHEKGGWS